MVESLHLGVWIERPAREVHAFLLDPRNLPAWATGLGGSIEERAGRWLADSPMGEVEVRFVGDNEYGVADHDVTLPDGTVVTNPLRVIAGDGGCEVVFTLRRTPEMSDEQWAEDAATVRSDLDRLAALLGTP